MDGGPVFQLSYDASRDDFERGLLARYDKSGVRAQSRLTGFLFVLFGLFMAASFLTLRGTADEVGPVPWILSGWVVLYGLYRWTMWDRRRAIRRIFRDNAALLDGQVDERLDSRGVVTRSPGMESHVAWPKFAAVIECHDLLVLCLGDFKRGDQWTIPRRGLADPDQWPDLVAFARARVDGEYFRSRR